MKVRYKPIEFEAVEVTDVLIKGSRDGWPEWLNSMWDEGDVWLVPGAVIMSSDSGGSYIGRIGDYLINDGIHVSAVKRRDFAEYFEVVS